MSIADDIKNLQDDIFSITQDIQTQIEGFGDQLSDLADGPMFDSRLGYSVPAMPVFDENFVPGQAGTGSDAPAFTGTIPIAPTLDSVNTDFTYNFETPGNVPNIDTSMSPDDIDYSRLDSITVPTVEQSVIPDRPDYDIPVSPILEDIVIPELPNFTAIPEFLGEAPSTIDPPALQTLNFTEEEYMSSLQTSAEAWLQNIIDNGGTGLSQAVEQGIYDRSRTRESAAFRQNIDEATDQFAASGFSRPNGALRAKIDNIRADYQNRVEDLNRKLTEDQEKLAQANTQFAVSETGKLEAVKMQFHSDVMDRSLKFAEALVSTHESVYNLKLAEYQARVESYKTDAQVHRDLIEAIYAEVNQYKAQVEASEVSSRVNDSKVNQYNSQVNALKAMVDFYRADMDAVKIHGEIEGLKLERYRTEVDAARIGIQAQSEQVRVIETQIKAQETKLTAYRAEVEAAKSYNDSERLKIEAKRAVIDSQLANNEKKIQSYESAVEGYKAAVYAHRAQVQAFEASQQSSLAYAEKDSRDSERKTKLEIMKAEISLRHSTTAAELFNLQKQYEADVNLKELDAQITAADRGMGHLTTVSSAALSQVNGIAMASLETSSDS